MKTYDTQSEQPSHELFHIAGEGRRSRWMRIGAAWPHKDGDGFSLDIELMPVKPGRFALRVKQQTEEGSSDETSH